MARLSKTAGEILDQKKTGIVAVRPGDTVLEALRLMAGKNIGALLVIEGGRLAGILSERDYARKVELAGKTGAATAVREIMTGSVVTVTPDQPAQDCLRLMSAKRIRHLPVVEGERVVGMLSNRDVLEEVIAEEEKLIKSLETERLIATTDPGTY